MNLLYEYARMCINNDCPRCIRGKALQRKRLYRHDMLQVLEQTV